MTQMRITVPQRFRLRNSEEEGEGWWEESLAAATVTRPAVGGP